MNSKPKTSATTHDAYLAVLSDEKRAALRRLRTAILSAAPGAQECISYQLAAFRLGGKMLVAMGASENHCAFYLMSSTLLDDFDDELAGYDTSKGTIRFQPAKPLPNSLVRKLVKARIAENRATGKRSN
jgi:uncharacterized protein YdhG (YjbR/CyaY superfamily)